MNHLKVMNKKIKSVFKSKKGSAVQMIIFAPFLLGLLILTSVEITTNVKSNELNNDITILMKRISRAKTFESAMTIIDNNIGANKPLKNKDESKFFKENLVFCVPKYEGGGNYNFDQKISLKNDAVNFENYWANGNLLEIDFRRILIPEQYSSITVGAYKLSLFQNSVSIKRKVMIEGSNKRNEDVLRNG